MPRKKKPAEQPPAAPPTTKPVEVTPTTPVPQRFWGQLGSEIKEESLQWLWHPWAAYSTLTLLVGRGGVGKSTLLAALIAHATGGPTIDGSGRKWGKAILLTGNEERVSVMTKPRLRHAGVDVDGRVRFLQDPDIGLVRDKAHLVAVAKSFGATLIVADPIDSYMDEATSENDGQHVRAFLEAAVWIAEQSGAAFVGIRHPGKDPMNVNPGSRSWRNVPRSVVVLTKDIDHPPQYSMRHDKDSHGTNSQPVRYDLMDDGSGPRRFVVREEMEHSAAEIASVTSGPTGRYKLLSVCNLIVWFFKTEDVPTRVALGNYSKSLGVGDDTLNDALRLLGIKSYPPPERGSPWRLMRTQEHWPEWISAVVPPVPGPEKSGDVENP